LKIYLEYQPIKVEPTVEQEVVAIIVGMEMEYHGRDSSAFI